MKTCIFLLILSVLCQCSLNAQNRSTMALLREIDAAIENAETYRMQKEAQIDSIKRHYRSLRSDRDRWEFNYRMFDVYRSYINDSAMSYLNTCTMIGEKMHRNDLVCIAKSDLAYQLTSDGMETEALMVLKTIKLLGVAMEKRVGYYEAYASIYANLVGRSRALTLIDDFTEKRNAYTDTVISLLPKNSDEYLSWLENNTLNKGDYAEAIKINDKRLAKTVPWSREMATVAFVRYGILNRMGYHEESKYWLALSALCDITHGVMNQTALWTLAEKLSKEGDVDRAHLYITYSWNVASVYGTQSRSRMLFPILSNIDNVYVNRLQYRTRLLFVFAGIEALMTLILIVLLYKNNRQRRTLADTQSHLREENKEKEELNRQLDSALKQVSEANEKLTESNLQLQKSNHQKESYIGTFLATCSVYIDKLDAYRLMVHRMVKNKQIDELYHITRSTESKEMELDELYANFDSVFLLLFPNFVEQFNSQLKPDCKQVPQKQGRLNTPLRIYALLRLGMTDSAKIASFLHCSINTIYNYRAKMRAATIGDSNALEKFVHSIASA